jgi:hypothetical protein
VSRLIAAAVLVVLWTAVAVAGEATTRGTMDLNKPGALEALQRSNPTHYDKVCKILNGILQQPDAAVPRHPPLNAASPSPPVTPPTDLPSDLPCRMAPVASLATPSPTHSPRSLAPSSFAAPPGSQNTDPQDTVTRSPGAAACGCNTAPINGFSPALPQNFQTAPEPGTPRRSSSKTAPPSPASSDDAVAI